MKTEANDSIHPKGGSVISSHGGLTKREYFAAMAMQGILAAQVATGYLEANAAAIMARRQADALIKELNAEESK